MVQAGMNGAGRNEWCRPESMVQAGINGAGRNEWCRPESMVQAGMNLGRFPSAFIRDKS